MAGFKGMLSGGQEDLTLNGAGWLEKYQINLETDILPACGRDKSRVLAWHHNLEDMILGQAVV